MMSPADTLKLYMSTSVVVPIRPTIVLGKIETMVVASDI